MPHFARSQSDKELIVLVEAHHPVHSKERSPTPQASHESSRLFATVRIIGQSLTSRNARRRMTIYHTLDRIPWTGSWPKGLGKELHCSFEMIRDRAPSRRNAAVQYQSTLSLNDYTLAIWLLWIWVGAVLPYHNIPLMMSRDLILKEFIVTSE